MLVFLRQNENLKYQEPQQNFKLGPTVVENVHVYFFIATNDMSLSSDFNKKISEN